MEYNLEKLSNILKNSKSLQSIIQKFNIDHKLIVCVGAEIEFYLSGNLDYQLLAKMIGHEIKKERGANQYEINLTPTTNILNFITHINHLKNMITKNAIELGGYAIFKSKPYDNDYGNSMHIHISFIDTHTMCYVQDMNFIDNIAISLCHFMLESVYIFLPKEEDYSRLDHKFLSPTHVSFGNNNRTVAVRIPDLVPTRVEHRVPANNIDLYLTFATILKSILIGMKSREIIKNINKTYGNAYDPIYNLIALPANIKEAKELFNPNFLLTENY